jgi:hypothetical protein
VITVDTFRGRIPDQIIDNSSCIHCFWSPRSYGLCQSFFVHADCYSELIFFCPHKIHQGEAYYG